MRDVYGINPRISFYLCRGKLLAQPVCVRNIALKIYFDFTSAGYLILQCRNTIKTQYGKECRGILEKITEQRK